jgi:hypothetical protein
MVGGITSQCGYKLWQYANKLCSEGETQDSQLVFGADTDGHFYFQDSYVVS